MNRLVIIGNGFDRAHGLPTSYQHFIDDFWKNIKVSHQKDLYKDIVLINKQYDGFLNLSINNFKKLIRNLNT